MKTAHLLINKGNHIVSAYEGKIFRRLKNGMIKEVGCKDKDGYIIFRYKDKMVKCHRFIYQQYHNVKLTPDQEIDHISKIKDDNRICNLRTVSRTQNCQNKSHMKNSTTGHKNVFWHKKANKYVVQIKSDGKSKHHGLFTNIEDAISKRDEVIKDLNSQGHIYSI
jgi:hypothetical protein